MTSYVGMTHLKPENYTPPFVLLQSQCLGRRMLRTISAILFFHLNKVDSKQNFIRFAEYHLLSHKKPDTMPNEHQPYNRGINIWRTSILVNFPWSFPSNLSSVVRIKY
jgi:hypothetical protein